MTTLNSNTYQYNLNTNLVEQQYNKAKISNSILIHKYPEALNLFFEGKSSFEMGNIEKAFNSFVEVTQMIWDQGIHDLEAASFYYIGCIELSIELSTGENSTLGLTSFNSALYKTQDNYLRLAVYNCLSIYYLSKYDPNKVHNYCDESFKIIDKLEKNNQITYYFAASNYNKSEAYVRENKYDNALPFIKEAHNQFSSLNLNAEIAKSNSLMGSILTMKGMYKEALPIIKSAHKYFKRLDNKSEIIECIRMKGLCYIGIGKRFKGCYLLKKAIKFSNKWGEYKLANIILAELTQYDIK